MTSQHIQKTLKELYIKFVTRCSDGDILKDVDPKLLKSFLSQALTEQHEKDVQSFREKIEELGHQQDDDTIWCNMDDLLASLDETEK